MKTQILMAMALLAGLSVAGPASAKMMKKGPGIDLLQDCMLSGDDKMSTSTVIGGKRDGTWDTCCSKTLGYCISCNREADQCSKRSYRFVIQTMKPTVDQDQHLAPEERKTPSPKPRLRTSPAVNKKITE